MTQNQLARMAAQKRQNGVKGNAMKPNPDCRECGRLAHEAIVWPTGSGPVTVSTEKAAPYRAHKASAHGQRS